MSHQTNSNFGLWLSNTWVSTYSDQFINWNMLVENSSWALSNHKYIHGNHDFFAENLGTGKRTKFDKLIVHTTKLWPSLVTKIEETGLYEVKGHIVIVLPKSITGQLITFIVLAYISSQITLGIHWYRNHLKSLENLNYLILRIS